MNWEYLGISSALFSKPQRADWEECREAGFCAAELSIKSHGESDTAEGCRKIGESIAADIRAAGLELWTVHIPYGAAWDPSAADEAERQANCRNIAELMRTAGEWGASGVVLHPSFEPVPLEDALRRHRLEQAGRSMETLAEAGKRAGVFLSVESLPRSCLGNCSGELLQMLGGSGATVCFDVNHLLRESHDHFLDAVGNRVQTLHLSDYDFVDECHWLPGDGKILWPELLAHLDICGYTGPLLFEISSWRLRPKVVRPADVIRKFRDAAQ